MFGPRLLSRPRRGLAIALVAVLASAACGGDDSDSGDEAAVVDPAAAAAAALTGTDETAEAGTEVTPDEGPQPLDPTSVRGAIIEQFSLELDDCFDRLEDLRDGVPVIVTTKIPCDEPHGFQVFSRLNYPADHPAVYPGDEAMNDYAVQVCYREFAGWVGAEYEVSELEIGVLTPPRANFEDSQARYRGIHCWVHRSDDEPMVGSMRGSGI